MNWFSGLEAYCRAEVPLAELTWYRLGGPAEWLIEPPTEAVLAESLRRCREGGIPWRVLGRGANLLVRDAGVRGAVVQLRHDAFQAVRFDGARVYAGAGADFPKLVKQSAERGLAGLEKLAGIPGTVGGIIRMNAGGKYASVGQFVRTVRLINRDGQLGEWPAERVGFAYRHTDLSGCVVLGATIELAAEEPAAVLARHRDIWNEKSASQPAVAERSCGCIFRNPPGGAAGALIDRLGLKEARRGGARISPRHANFIVAQSGATAQDVLDLIALAKDRVRDAYGVELELEVEIW